MEVNPEILEEATTSLERIDQDIEDLKAETAGRVQKWREHFDLIGETLTDYAHHIKILRERLPEQIILNDLSAQQQNEVVLLQHFHIHELEALQTFGRSSKAVHEQIDWILEIHRDYLEPFRQAEEKDAIGIEVFQQRTRIVEQSQRQVEQFRASLIQQGRDMFRG